MATISIDYEQWQKLERERAELAARVTTLETRALEATLEDPAGRIRVQHEIFKSALTCLQFCVANLHPLTVRGWPYKDLRAVANALPTIPGAHRFAAELAHTFHYFTNLAEKWENARADGREKQLLAEENASMVPSVERIKELFGQFAVIEPGATTFDLPPLTIPDP